MNIKKLEGEEKLKYLKDHYVIYYGPTDEEGDNENPNSWEVIIGPKEMLSKYKLVNPCIDVPEKAIQHLKKDDVYTAVIWLEDKTIWSLESNSGKNEKAFEKYFGLSSQGGDGDYCEYE